MPGELTAWLSASESKFLLSMLGLCEQREGGLCVPRGDYSCVATIYSLCLRRTEYNYTPTLCEQVIFQLLHGSVYKKTRENLDFSLAVI